MPDIVDLTAKTPKQMTLPGDPPITYTPKIRPSVRIDSVVLHQTSFSRGDVPERYLTTVAHFVVMPNGGIVQLHAVEKELWASSAFNEDSIAIEFVGNFRDDRRRYSTEQGTTTLQSTFTPQQIRGGQDLVAYLQRTWGLSFIFAHRQGEDHNKRGNCPGPDIWYNIGEWAKTNLQMDDGGKGYVEGPGSPIPESWRTPL